VRLAEILELQPMQEISRFTRCVWHVPERLPGDLTKQRYLVW
jgi:hypothetical protein